jgi:Ca2+-binding EF-hand superfamily protein
MEVDEMGALTKQALGELRATFNYNDANGDGVLSYDEFVRLMTDLEAGLSLEELKIGFDEIDTDRNGSIGFDEFVAWWTSD